MTQEQKVRTRDEQVVKMAREAGEVPSDYYKWAERHLKEAEARGAAEAMKDSDPIDWQVRDIRGGLGDWKGCTESAHEEYKKHSTVETRALYAHPANVATLESRIAELEGALKEAIGALGQVKDCERGGYRARNGKFVELQMSDGERADIIHSDVTTECEAAFESARAALKREGEV